MTVDPRQRLEEGISHLVDERKIISGIAVSYGDLTRGEAFCRGNLREVRLQDGAFVPDVAPLKTDSIFDLASVTKLFTCIAVLQLMERGKLRLDRTLGSIDKRFSRIPDVTIEDLLCFRAQLQTTARMDAASSADEAEKLGRTAAGVAGKHARGLNQAGAFGRSVPKSRPWLVRRMYSLSCSCCLRRLRGSRGLPMSRNSTTPTKGMK